MGVDDDDDDDDGPGCGCSAEADITRNTASSPCNGFVVGVWLDSGCMLCAGNPASGAVSAYIKRCTSLRSRMSSAGRRSFGKRQCNVRINGLILASSEGGSLARTFWGCFSGCAAGLGAWSFALEWAGALNSASWVIRWSTKSALDCGREASMLECCGREKWWVERECGVDSFLLYNGILLRGMISVCN